MRQQTAFVGKLMAGLLALSFGIAAQPRISTRYEPRADQVLHMTTTQALRLSSEAQTESAAGTPLLVTESELRYVQTNGRFDDGDRMKCQLTIVDFSLKQYVNGNPKPSGNIGALAGRTLTAIVDRGGKLVDLQVPEDLKQASTVLKQLVAGAYGVVNLLPAESMSVGDTVTIPSSIPLRLRAGVEPMQHQTRALTTLRALEKHGGQRVARLEQRIESAGTETMKVNGVGTIDVNLDRGFVAASSTEWTFLGYGIPGSASQAPTGAVRATMQVSVTAHE
jgi:hypothetical protein